MMSSDGRGADCIVCVAAAVGWQLGLIAMNAVLLIITALIGVMGGVACVVVADRLRRQRKMADKDQLREWLFFFDRPAWRGPVTWKSDLRAYDAALADTLRAINTGYLATRSGAPLDDHRARGKSELQDNNFREAMEDIVHRLEKVRALVAEVRANPSKMPGAAPEIDAERDRIVTTLNDSAAAFGLRGLPVPTSIRRLDEVHRE